MRKSTFFLFGILLAGLLAGVAPAAQDPAGSESADDAIGRTPPRVSLIEGEVSFLRPGAQEWVQAQLNIPLAPGDQLFAGADSRVEIQIGAQAFVRGGANTQIGLESREPDFLQFKVTAGQASLDLRALAPGRLVEVDTPNAAFTVGLEGYYRLDVGDERTVFITRRAGRATAISAEGEKIPIGPNTAVTFEGVTNPSISSEPASGLDPLDQWNYARTEQLLKDQTSARYVSPESYGISELDRYGSWRVVPTYGAVWVPSGVGPDWAPYSTGVWMNDPYYGWTWVDTAPWGWAPYHYGRWVHYSGLWCWAPGPRVIRPVYAPALVAFFGAPGVQVSVSVGAPLVGWVPLGWGEPLVPWWGRPGFRHRPWWGGWGGPRVVNERVIQHRAVRVGEIRSYSNARVRNAVVTVREEHFGHRPVAGARVRSAEGHRLRPTHAAPAAAAGAGLVPTHAQGPRPPDGHASRGVVKAGRAAGEPAVRVAPVEGDKRRPPQRMDAPQRPRPGLPGRVEEGPRSPVPPGGRIGAPGGEGGRDARPAPARPEAPQPRPDRREGARSPASPRGPDQAPAPAAPQPPPGMHGGGAQPNRPAAPGGRLDGRAGGTTEPPPAQHPEAQRPLRPNRGGGSIESDMRRGGPGSPATPPPSAPPQERPRRPSGPADDSIRSPDNPRYPQGMNRESRPERPSRMPNPNSRRDPAL